MVAQCYLCRAQGNFRTGLWRQTVAIQPAINQSINGSIKSPQRWKDAKIMEQLVGKERRNSKKFNKTLDRASVFFKKWKSGW